MQVAPSIGVITHHLTGVVDAEGMGDTCRSGRGQRRDDAAAKHKAVLGRCVAGAIGPHDDALAIDAEGGAVEQHRRRRTGSPAVACGVRPRAGTCRSGRGRHYRRCNARHKPDPSHRSHLDRSQAASGV